DLPIALGVLVATGQLAPECVERIAAVGELALDGAIRPVRGVLPVVRLTAASRETTLIVPPANVREAQLVSEARIAAPCSLGALVRQLRGGRLITPPLAPGEPTPNRDIPD